MRTEARETTLIRQTCAKYRQIASQNHGQKLHWSKWRGILMRWIVVFPCPIVFGLYHRSQRVHSGGGGRDSTLLEIYEINFPYGIFSLIGRSLSCFFCFDLADGGTI